MSFELDVAIKAAVILAGVAMLAWTLRRASASLRHTIWMTGLAAALAVPLVVPWVAGRIPGFQLPLLPETEDLSARAAVAGDGDRGSALPDAGTPEPEFSPQPATAAAVSTADVLPGEAVMRAGNRAEAEPGRSAAGWRLLERVGADSWTWRHGFLLAWVLGAGFVFAGWLTALWDLRRLRRGSTAPGGSDERSWFELLTGIKRELDLGAPVELRIACREVSPMTWGILRHVILLPASADGWPETRRRVVLTHELAHVKRRDMVGEILSRLVCGIYWFNPLAWYAARRLYAERERACDDDVLRLGVEPASYADDLFQIARGLNSGFFQTAAPMAHPSLLASRVKAILDPDARRNRTSMPVAASLLGVTAVLTVALASIQVTALASMIPTLPTLLVVTAPVYPPQGPIVAPLAPPVRFGGTDDPEGALIYGIVMAPGSREPMPGVRVQLAGPDRTVIEVARGEKIAITTTDADGRFDFRATTPGGYTIQALYPEDLDRANTLNARRLTIDTSTGGGFQQYTELYIPLRARVSGRVFGPDGEPLAGASVAPFQLIWSNGNIYSLVGAVHATAAQTDENGQYTVLLPAGEYYLRVSPLGEQLTNRVFQPQYYPGVRNAEDAIPVTVRAGVDLAAFDIRLRPSELFHIRFHLPLPEYLPGIPEPLSSYAQSEDPIIEALVRPLGRGRIDGGPLRQISLESIGDDVWRMAPLAAGTYEMAFMYSSDLSNRFRDVNWSRLSPIARLRIAVESNDAISGSDLDLGTIVEGPKITIPGRVLIRNSGGPNAELIERILDLLFRGGPDGQSPYFGFMTDTFFRPPLTVAPGGTFILDGVAPGILRPNLPPDVLDLPDSFYIASIASGAYDMLKEGLVVDGGPVNPIEIVVSDGAGRIEGVARNSDNAFVPYARVVLIPPLSHRGPMVRFPTARANSSGVYALERVPPGEYRLLALDDAGRFPELSQYLWWEDPELLRRFESRSQPVTVITGSRIVIHPEAILAFE